MEYKSDCHTVTTSNHRLIKSIKTPGGYEVRVESWDSTARNSYFGTRSWEARGELYVWIPALGSPRPNLDVHRETFESLGLWCLGPLGTEETARRSGQYGNVGYFCTSMEALDTEEGRTALSTIVNRIEANLVMLDEALDRVLAPDKAREEFLARLAK